ncbi:MAG: hypothetical protein KAT49_04140, partial [Methanomicrobia archaeon]|nr:hypothetical protein [Methanomicrobia archaeon]
KEKKKEFKEVQKEIINKKKYPNLEEYQERLYRMILYCIGRHDWYDKIRLHFLDIGLAFCASSIAAITLISKYWTGLCFFTKIFILLAVLIILILGLLLIYFYNESLGEDHPYRKIADIRSWYFIYNLPYLMDSSLSKNKDEAKKQIESVINSFKASTNRWLEYTEDPYDFIREDLEQVFILQLLQKYRYQFIKRMSKYLSGGLILASIFSILALISHLSN